MQDENLNERISIGIVDEPNDIAKRGQDTLRIQEHANALTTLLKVQRLK